MAFFKRSCSRFCTDAFVLCDIVSFGAPKKNSVTNPARPGCPSCGAGFARFRSNREQCACRERAVASIFISHRATSIVTGGKPGESIRTATTPRVHREAASGGVATAAGPVGVGHVSSDWSSEGRMIGLARFAGDQVICSQKP